MDSSIDHQSSFRALDWARNGIPVSSLDIPERIKLLEHLVRIYRQGWGSANPPGFYPLPLYVGRGRLNTKLPKPQGLKVMCLGGMTTGYHVIERGQWWYKRLLVSTKGDFLTEILICDRAPSVDKHRVRRTRGNELVEAVTNDVRFVRLIKTMADELDTRQRDIARQVELISQMRPAFAVIEGV